jgi:putative membrane protein
MAWMLATAAAAQGHPMTGTSVGPSGTAAGDAYGVLKPGDADAADYRRSKDREFVKKALDFETSEAKLAQLAQQNSQSEDIKQLGQKLAEDQKQLDSQIQPLATQLGVSAPKDLSRKDKQLIAKLEGLSGEKFDEEFIKAVAKDHQQSLKEFNEEAKATQTPAVSDAAKDCATVLTQHLQQIDKVAQGHNLTIEGMSKKSSGN